MIKVALQRDHGMVLFRRLKTPFMEDLPDGEAGSPFGPRSAGDLLRQQREALGLDLDEVAAALRIKSGYLGALEAGRPELLPGPAYAIGFVRAYADHLRLDSDEILRRFKAESAALDTKPDLAFPMPLGEDSVPGAPMLLVALILALCGYGTWYYVSTGDHSHPERITEVPPELAARIFGQPGGVPASSASEPLPETQLAITPDVAPPKPGSAGSEAAPATGGPGTLSAMAHPPAAGSSSPAPSVPGAGTTTSPGATTLAGTTTPADPTAALRAEGPPAYGALDGTARIVIRATSDSWIQIKSTDQTPLFTRILKPGESYMVPDRPGVSMRTGNAGGLEITVDGKPTASIGPNGAVRTLPLEPQALLAKVPAGG
jgi:cytoskeleton protein RodZ